MSTLCSLTVSHGFFGREDADDDGCDEVMGALALVAGTEDEPAAEVEGAASALVDGVVAAALSL